MRKKQKKQYKSQEESNWLRSFTIHLRKQCELAAKDINWNVAQHLYQSSKYTPEAAAKRYHEAWNSHHQEQMANG